MQGALLSRVSVLQSRVPALCVRGFVRGWQFGSSPKFSTTVEKVVEKRVLREPLLKKLDFRPVLACFACGNARFSVILPSQCRQNGREIGGRARRKSDSRPFAESFRVIP